MKLLLLGLSGCTWIPIGEHFAAQGDLRSPADELPDDPLPECHLPEVELLALDAPGDDQFAPMWLGFEWSFHEQQNAVTDFGWLTGDVAAQFIVHVYGPEADLLCSIYYDAEGAEPASGLPPDGPLVAAWELPNRAAVHTDCPELDPELYGTADLRELLDGGWAFGLGELGRMEPIVENVMDADGIPRDQWERWTLGAYVTYAGQAPEAMSYDISYKSECAEVLLEEQAPVEQRQNLDEPLKPAIHQASDYYVRAFAAYSNESCEPDVILAGDWEPGGEIMEGVDLVSVSLDVVPAPGGGFADFWWDTDEPPDGIPEPQASNVVLGLHDAYGIRLCNLLFDVAEAEEIDPANLVSQTGELWRAWMLDLEDPTSYDCTQLDPLVFGTNDPLELLEDWEFGFAVGELVALAGDDMDPDAFGVYVTTDGVLAEEMGVGKGYDLDGCFVRDPSEQVLPVSVTSGGLTSHWLTTAYFAYELLSQ